MVEGGVSRHELNEILQAALLERDKLWEERFERLQNRLVALEGQPEASDSLPDSQARAVLSASDANVVPRAAKRKLPACKSELTCYICKGTNSVRKHRELGVPLDDKCRKQIEIVKRGGALVQRRQEWANALKTMSEGDMPNRLAHEMLALIEGTVAQESARKKRKVSEEVCENKTSTGDECSQCTICQDQLHINNVKQCELPCHHKFHESCIVPWLKSKPNPSCPVCRTNVKLEYPDGKDGNVKVVLGTQLSVECSPCDVNMGIDAGTSNQCVVSPPVLSCSDPLHENDESCCGNQSEGVWEELPIDFEFNEHDIALLNDVAFEEDTPQEPHEESHKRSDPLSLTPGSSFNASFGCLDGVSFGG